jgi:hypothetical protein
MDVDIQEGDSGRRGQRLVLWSRRPPGLSANSAGWPVGKCGYLKRQRGGLALLMRPGLGRKRRRGKDVGDWRIQDDEFIELNKKRGHELAGL